MAERTKGHSNGGGYRHSGTQSEEPAARAITTASLRSVSFFSSRARPMRPISAGHRAQPAVWARGCRQNRGATVRLPALPFSLAQAATEQSCTFAIALMC